MTNQFRTIVVSYIQLGSAESKSKELNNFLKQYKCDHLILNGDIIDSRHFKKEGLLSKKYIRLYNRLLKLIKNNHTRVTVVLGNHDGLLHRIAPLQNKHFRLVKEMVYKSGHRKFYVVHGDKYDLLNRHFIWLQTLGKYGYQLAVWCVHHFEPSLRKNHGSLSTYIKVRFHNALQYITDFENQLTKVARMRQCQGIICGHTHVAGIKQLGDIMYLNSGDWVDSLSALVEDHNGEWNLIYYNESTNKTSIGKNPVRISAEVVNLKTYQEVSNYK